jgi:hypothetical protein
VHCRNSAPARASKVAAVHRRGDGSRRYRLARQMMLLVGAGVVVAVGAQSAVAADWSIQTAPRPAHAGATELSGVSCASTSDCMAVGQSVPPSTLEPIPLVEHWNGTSWSVERTPIPAHAGWAGELGAVSCASSGACMAVGFYFDNESGLAPLAERWNGSFWATEPTPPGLEASEFYGVSCASSSACTAVGSGSNAFAARWNGKRWSVDQSNFGSSPELLGVSCLSAGTCAVVGADDIGLCAYGYSDYFVPMFGFWRSGRWSLRQRPNLGCSNSSDSGGGNGLNAVSCTSPAACIAVGTRVYRWDGRRWKTQQAPNGGDALDGVSCTASSACTAVGSDIDTWNGSSWASTPVARPAHATGAGLSSVSCTSQASCVAVGTYEDRKGNDRLLVESTGIGS